MVERTELERKLSRARRVLMIMNEEAAWFGKLHVPEHLQQDIHEQLAEITNLERSLAQIDNLQGEIFPDNLPLSPATFVGRNDEIARCLKHLSHQESVWGVAIDGSSGIGKTTLAIKVAHEVRRRDWFDAYLFFSARTTWHAETGAYLRGLGRSPLDTFVREFALLLNKEHIPRITNTKDRRRALLEQLQNRRVLLVLDNLETLTPAEHDLIAVFLHNLPPPNKAIITSSHRMGVRGVPIRLDPLSEQETLTLMTNLGNRHLRVSAELSRAEMSTRLALSEAVGGNPLLLSCALGLVAQQRFSLKQVIEHLHTGTSSKDVYEILFTEAVRSLGRPERVVLSTLAVFQNPATPRLLTNATEMDATEVQIALEHLMTLVLVYDMRGGHYGLHPLTRNYVSDLLTSGEKATHRSSQHVSLESAAYRRAFRYWVDYAQEHGGSKNFSRFPRLEAEWLNLEATAVALYDLTGLPDRLTDKTLAVMFSDLALALRSFMRSYGYWDEWLRLSMWAYEVAVALEDWHNASWRAYDAAFIHWNRTETALASEWTRRMEISVQKSGNRRDRVIVTRLQGLVAEQRGALKEAEYYYREALSACRNLEERADEASLLNDLGELYRQQRDYDRARQCYLDALALDEKTGDKEDQATYSGNLGNLALVRGHLEEAQQWYEREMALAKEVGRHDLVARAQSGLARVYEKQGRHVEALPLAEEAMQIRKRLHDRMREGTRELVARLRSHKRDE
jgi:tetratricopeptide (TPR) repeat protein